MGHQITDNDYIILDAVLPYIPISGPFNLTNYIPLISPKHYNYYTGVEQLFVAALLVREGFAKMIHASKAEQQIELTDLGRELKRSGSLKNYLSSAVRNKAKKK